jgi:hypothetical protein
MFVDVTNLQLFVNDTGINAAEAERVAEHVF